MDVVVIKAIESNIFHEPTRYHIPICPKYIEDEVWGHTIKVGSTPDFNTKVEYFHFSWLGRLKEVCDKHNVKIILNQ